MGPDTYSRVAQDRASEFFDHALEGGECEVVYQGCVKVRRTSKNGRSKSGGARCHRDQGCCWCDVQQKDKHFELPSTLNRLVPLVRLRKKSERRSNASVSVYLSISPSWLSIFVEHLQTLLQSRATVFVRIRIGTLCLIKPHMPQVVNLPWSPELWFGHFSK